MAIITQGGRDATAKAEKKITPTKIKAHVLEAAARALWEHSARGNWADVHGRTRDLVISEATAVITAYEAARADEPIEED